MRNSNEHIEEARKQGLFTCLEQSKVTRIDRGVYRVRSATEPGLEYTVDVFANGGLGECDCKNFQLSLLPKFQRFGEIPYDSFRCKHIKRVRCHILDMIITGQSEAKDNGKPLYKSRRKTETDSSRCG